MVTGTHKTSPEGVLQAGGILDRIVDAKIKRLEDARLRWPLDQIAAAAETASSREPKRLVEALDRRDRINIIAEIKQRSPSKGVISKDFNPARIAEGYANAGAAALSVLAEEDFFGGSLDDLRSVRDQVHLPLLRKDFIFDEYQLYESVLAGADAVLLIVAILEDQLLAKLITLATELGLDSLVEVHTADEMSRAIRAGAFLIGVNNRDLTTFAVNLSTSIKLATLAPAGAILVSESGITSGRDIQRLKSAGFSAFLIGEHLMRASDPGETMRRLFEEAALDRN